MAVGGGWKIVHVLDLVDEELLGVGVGEGGVERLGVDAGAD